jgi:hypothetical protein
MVPVSTDAERRRVSPSCGHQRPLAALLALGLALGAGSSAGAPPELWGYGVRSCTDYLDAYAAADDGNAAAYQRYEDWLTGFVSGLNLALDEDVLSGSGIETAMRRTRDHCERKPGDDFFAATMDLVRMLTSLR